MNKNQKLIFGIAGAAIAATALFFSTKKVLAKGGKEPTISKPVDLKSYLGDWYDIGHYPVSFQRNCYGSMANYSLNEDGTIKVINTCNKGSLDGPKKEVEGKAWVVDKTTNAKLKVQFFWPFKGDYWILEYGDDYKWAIVGHPKLEYLWILSRTPTLDEATLSYILQRITEYGYDTDKIDWEKQI